MSAAEDLLAFQLEAVGIEFEREVVFAAPRKWRADFVIPVPDEGCAYVFKGTANPCRVGRGHGIHHGLWHNRVNKEEDHDFVTGYEDELPQILIEIDGGAFVAGRHGRGAGIRADLEKLNKATELGYRVLRFLPEQVDSGEALTQIERCLHA